MNDQQALAYCYIEGTVQRLDLEGKEKGYAAFVILVDKEGWPGPGTIAKDYTRIGQTFFVPMEIAWGEYDGRILNLTVHPNKE